LWKRKPATGETEMQRKEFTQIAADRHGSKITAGAQLALLGILFLDLRSSA
jgi:hypothetical protein